MNEPNTPELLEIRKYSNRRYYDTTRSQHLTLEQIRSLVRDGHSVRVIDSKSGTDITAQVLTQIILELETPKLAAVPVSFLTQLIRLNEQMISLRQPYDAWMEYPKQIEERFRQLQGLQNLYPPFGAWPSMSPPPSQNKAETREASELRSALDRLQGEVAALRSKLEKGKQQKRRRKR